MSLRPYRSSAIAPMKRALNLRAQTRFVKTTLPRVETVSSGASRAVSICRQAELKGWMAPRAIHYPKAEYLRYICLVGVPILASKLRPNANDAG